jgi:uncharacterized protein (TIGR02996 family)
MNDEQDLLRAILADPGDHATRRVYADWLEERGDPVSLHRAEYLRTECELDALPAEDRRRRRLRARLLELHQVVGDEWWRQLDYAKVEYCIAFAYRCPQRWDTLTPTDDEAVRHCPACQRDVHYCRSEGEAQDRADAGECVAIDSRELRFPLELLRRQQETGRLLGRVAPRVPARLPLHERGPRAGGE